MKNVTMIKPETFERAARDAGARVRPHMVGAFVSKGLRIVAAAIRAPAVAIDWVSNIFARGHEARLRAGELRNRDMMRASRRSLDL